MAERKSCSQGVSFVQVPGAWLPRKAATYNPAPAQGRTKAIEAIEAIGMRESQCILVDSADHLYVTAGYTLTHNTQIFLALMMDAKLGTRGTARNWNTVLKLAALVGL